jgi:hypothetical protein
MLDAICGGGCAYSACHRPAVPVCFSPCELAHALQVTLALALPPAYIGVPQEAAEQSLQDLILK